MGMGERPGDRREPAIDAREGDAAVSGDESDGEFEFPFVSWGDSAGGAAAAAAAADELFAEGRIRTFYPVFGRVLDVDAPAPAPERRPPLGRLFLEEARNSSVGSTSSSSSSDAADLDGVSPDSYCLWTPGSSPASSPSQPPRKSGSTGSMARWRRISELVIGRSRSDGKEKFLFLSAPPSPARDAKSNKQRPPRQSKAATELDTVAAGHRMLYGAKTAAATGGARRTFLPYRQDLVGLFANVNGLNRGHHRPF